ncbi:MAG: hypothetical protein DRN04_09215 [Thermoprotei archaeon]|nr:MAG: hypothetical protein DRN04_09215 [Thermoprotei archaeon]
MNLDKEDLDILEYYKSYGVLRRQVEILKLELKGLTNERERLKNEILSLLDRVETLRREVDELEDMRRELIEEIKRLEEEKEKLSRELQIMRTAGISVSKSYEDSLALTKALQELLLGKREEVERKPEELEKPEEKVTEKPSAGEKPAVKVEEEKKVQPPKPKEKKEVAKKPPKSVLASLLDENMKKILKALSGSQEVVFKDLVSQTNLPGASVRSLVAILWGYNLVEMKTEEDESGKIVVKYILTDKGKKILEEIAES